MVHHRAVFSDMLQRSNSLIPGSVLLFFNYDDYNPIMLAIQLTGQDQKKSMD